MRNHSICRSAAILIGCFLGSRALSQETPLPPKTSPEKSKREWHWKTDQAVYQLVTVAKVPKFQVQGLPFESKIRYKILSKLTMRISPFDNSLTINQRVETTKLEEADDLSKTVLTKLLKDLTGKTLTIRVDQSGEIVKIEGVPEPAAGMVSNGLDAGHDDDFAH